MPRPSNTRLREEVREARLFAELADPLRSKSDIHAEIAETFKIPLRSVWYYLRVDNADTRVRYTDAERHRLCAMTRKELKAYAEKCQISFDAIYTMVWRFKSQIKMDVEEQRAYERLCAARGFMDFVRKQDLKVFGLPGDAFKEARKVVRTIPGLDLLGPNFLIHTFSKKFYPLSLSEQRAILTTPRQFLKQRAQHISSNWLVGDPAGGYHFALVNAGDETPERGAMVVSTHDTFVRAAEAARVMLKVTPMSKPEIRRVLGSTREAACIRFSEGTRLPAQDPSLKDIPDSVLHHMVANLTPGSTWHGHAVAALNRRSGIVETTSPNEDPGYEEGWEEPDD